MTIAERPVLVAPDSFKGTFSAAQVAGAIGRGLERAGLLPPDLCPVADGGEGTLDVLLPQLGGELIGVEVQGPLGKPVRTGFGLVEDGGTAIVEMAMASGLGLVDEAERDAWAASTYGTGQLIAAAAQAGAEVILVAVGGSATTDGGAGALQAIEDAGGIGRAKIVVLCDVRTPFEDAPRVFGPQKGADPEMVKRLERRLDEFAQTLPKDPRGVPMTGCAGGLSGGLWAALGAKLEPGAPFVLEALDFDERMKTSRAVVTGEGRLDEQTLQGKLVGEIGTRARQAGVPLHAIVGQDAMDPFLKRIIDLQMVQEATTLEELEAAGERLGEALATGRA
ncbi:MAG TPA: glycerate kinase [Solirubrobacter sp.]|nr:glycerate kinase [Solirubrobacter sp.]